MQAAHLAFIFHYSMSNTPVKILYVEDEPFLGKIVKESLESRGYVVAMTDNGADAFALYAQHKPNICVLDVMLPKKDGFQIGKEIRAVHPTIPIIFVTAKNQTQDVIKGFESGGNDYIRKPFSMEELIVRIDNLLALTKTPSDVNNNPVLTLGRYAFHTQRYELSIDDQLKKLSHKEAALLQLLAANKNAITNRKDILLKLWGDDSFFNSRNLDVYITKLREYLKEDDRIQIITIKGIGYNFTISG
jgi:DNA-binding response OmpR family regulator